MKIIKRLLQINLPRGKSAFLWGPRKVGKTYWISHTLKAVEIIDFLKTDVLAEYISRPALLRDRYQNHRGLIVIDEAIGQHGRTLVEHARKVFEGLVGFGHDELLLQVAKSDHLLWKAKLVEVIYGRQNLSEGEIKDHTQCRLGRWYYGEGRARFGELAPFRAMEAPHAAVHRLGREIAELSAKGAMEEAVARLEQLDQQSGQIFAHIDALLAELHRG